MVLNLQAAAGTATAALKPKLGNTKVEAKAEEQISVVDFLFVSLFVPKVLVLLIPTEVLTENI